MKATYQAPAVEQLLADTDMLLVASLPEVLTEGQNLENAPTTEETSGNLSRNSIWDDED